MKFYVIWSDGRKFGPADIPTLIQWAKEGRINRDTQVENADTGQQGRARDIQGMQWPTSAPTTDLGGGDPTLKAGEAPMKSQSSGPIIPGQPQPYVAGRPVEGQPQQPQQPAGTAHDPLRQQPTAQQQPSPYQQSPYQNPPQPGGTAYNRHMDDGSQKLVSQAWILIVIGILCCFCTPFGIYSANRAKIMGNPNANTPFIVGWVLFGLQVIGVAIRVLLIVMAGRAA